MKIRGQRVIPPVERILSFVAKDEGGCWNWTGSVRSADKPYGRLIVGSRIDGSRRTVGAHQYSYEVFKGPIPDGLCVCHHCDNPRCVNPDHLFLGTKKDNADDRDRKGRNKNPRILCGEASPSAKLTDVEVAEIRLSALSSTKIAQKFGVGSSYIRQIRRGVWRRPAPPALIPGGSSDV